MPLFFLILLAAIQGVTEFLPVSSSGHLIILPHLLGVEDQGQALDVAVHLGTLVAVIIYFWRDVRFALTGIGHILIGRRGTPEARLATLLIISTIPVIAAGLVFKLTGFSDMLRSTKTIGWSMLFFGFVLYWADRVGTTDKQAKDWNLKDAVTMGIYQVLALIPGTSRSGITITGARFLGYKREDAARLSMLMSIPTIIASGGLLGLEVVADADWGVAKDGLIAAIFSCIAALISLSLMMRLLKSVSFTPYVIYRTALGLFLLWWAYS